MYQAKEAVKDLANAGNNVASASAYLKSAVDRLYKIEDALSRARSAVRSSRAGAGGQLANGFETLEAECKSIRADIVTAQGQTVSDDTKERIKGDIQTLQARVQEVEAIASAMRTYLE